MENLRLLRKQRGLTMKQVAEAVNVSASAISQYEAGKREPDYCTLKAIANFHGVTIDYLLGYSDECGKHLISADNSVVSICHNGIRIEYKLSGEDLELVRQMLCRLTKITLK